MIATDATRKFRLLDVEQFLKMPAPTWLVDGIVPASGQTMLFGQSGDGKSFLALDLALSIATGRAWNGRRVRQGPIIYLAAEGAAGLARRTDAWLRYYAVDENPGAFFVADAPQLHIRNEVDALLKAIRDSPNLEKPALIVADTFARCFVGGDENTSQDVGQWIAGAGRIQTETGGAFMTVHHTKKPSTNDPSPTQEPGSSAFRGAADAMILVQKDRKGVVKVTCGKQKDAEEFEPIHLRFEKVVWQSESGEQDSCVLVAGESVGQQSGVPTQRQAQILNFIGGYPDGAPTGVCVVELNKRGIPERTFYAERTVLEKLGFVGEIKRGVYGLTPTGRIFMQLQTTCN